MIEISKTYEPAAIEAKWYADWEAKGCFAADPARVSATQPAYSIVIPPPNVTGVLTLGHVLNNTIQDILARRARMTGHEVLWLPGTDHAGIATQNVVEKTLRKEGKMKHRDDLGREALVAKIWEWKEQYGGIILKQLRALGASCDWSRTRFTMDEDYSQCVSRVFVDLYKKGLIYRGKRMVNWCPGSLTALSDEEVIPKASNSFLYYFKVEVIEEPGRWLTIATTRPETIPGDTAIAVNPKDARYADLIGKHVRRPLPLENQAPLPIVGDDAVVFDFGTGVLKVTPAHDKADFEIGQRHALPVLDIMHPNAVMNDLAGTDLAGLDRFAARKRAVELLGELGVLEKEEPYQNNVGYSERADVPIESRLSEQWFLKYPSVAEARACVEQEENEGAPGGNKSPASHLAKEKLDIQPTPGAQAPDHDSSPAFQSHVSANTPQAITPSDAISGTVIAPSGNPESSTKMRFYPSRWAKVYDHWLGGIQDWCISRQLWWGHRVPVWSKQHIGWTDACHADYGKIRTLLHYRKDFVVNLDSEQTPHESSDKPIRLYVAISPDESKDSDQLNYIKQIEAMGFTQDTDVLDTWFSSWLWPFATMGWTGNKEADAKNPTLAAFYPTTDLVTGPDIIFFWVARMIMAGYEWMGELPFRNVYFTGIIRDKQGRKMSKSLGNSPDPLDIIAKFGADALRFGVMRSAPLGADVLFDEKNVELGRNFCTKLWNAARFRQMQGGESEGDIAVDLLTSDDKWILLRLDAAIAEVTAALTEYRFSDAANALYRFFWSEYCDWYVEASKATLQGEDAARKASTLAVMDFVFSHTLRLFHPFMPFITEELWQGMGFATDMPPQQGGETIMFAPWPKVFTAEEREYFRLDESDERLANARYELVNQGRALRRDYNIGSSKRVRFLLRPTAPVAPHDVAVLQILLNADPLEIVAADWPAPKGTPTTITPLGELLLPLDGLLDVAAERERIAKERTKVEQELQKVRAKLADESFTAKVPAKVLEEHRTRETDWAEKLAQLDKMGEALG